MTKYENNGGDSGIRSYEIQSDGIVIEFTTGAIYLYTNASAGALNIAEMKKLAILGSGLNSFIMKNVRTKYHAKLK